MEKCPCHSQKDYAVCCEPLLKGTAKAATAEALMRSRYTAHVKADIDYIMNTLHSSRQAKMNRATIEDWAKKSEWLRLQVLSTTGGQEQDTEGRVVFRAEYKQNNRLEVHLEDSLFLKENGTWFFVEGREPVRATPTSKPTKIGRNDPCYCGSGKKYKKCCARK